MKYINYLADSEEILKIFLYKQGISRKSLRAIKDNGALFVNNKHVTVRTVLQQGDQITVQLPNETPSPNLIAYNEQLNILFEDNWLLIVSKGPFKNIAPSREHKHESLVESVLYYMNNNQEETIPHIVTRLDRNTSGIVIFAKHQLIHHMMAETVIDKYYIACVNGVVKSTFGEIKAPIGRAKHSIIERQVTEEGKFAHTKYEVLRHNDKYTLLKLKLLTGRTHQLRVHMAYLGHPIIGDGLYGGICGAYQHQQLQCYKVQFVHPVTKKKISIIDKMNIHL